MKEVIAISNQKGGVGKTTTTINLGVALKEQNKKVLLVDLDPQANLTDALGYNNPNIFKGTITDAMLSAINDESIDRNIILHHDEGVDLIPCDIELSGMDITLVNTMSREQVLKQVIEEVKEDYDYILIDCPPTLGMLPINALTAANSVIIPVQAEFLPTKGMNQLLMTMKKIQKNLNPNLEIKGILITMTDERTNLSKKIKKDIHSKYGKSINVFSTNIPRCVKASESTGVGESVHKYDPAGQATIAYKLFAKEVIVNGEKEHKRYKSNNVR